MVEGPDMPISIAGQFEPLVQEVLMLEKGKTVLDFLGNKFTLYVQVANMSADIPAVSKAMNIFSQSGKVCCRSCWAHWDHVDENDKHKSFSFVSNLTNLKEKKAFIAEPKMKTTLLKGLEIIQKAETKTLKKLASSAFGVKDWSPLYRLKWKLVCM